MSWSTTSSSITAASSSTSSQSTTSWSASCSSCTALSAIVSSTSNQCATDLQPSLCLQSPRYRQTNLKENPVEDTYSDIDESLHEVNKELLEQDSDLCHITTADPASVCATCGLSELSRPCSVLYHDSPRTRSECSRMAWHHRLQVVSWKRWCCSRDWLSWRECCDLWQPHSCTTVFRTVGLNSPVRSVWSR